MEMLRECAATSVRGEDWRRVGPIIAVGANATIEMRPGLALDFQILTNKICDLKLVVS